GPTECSPCAKATTPTWCSSAAARAWRPSCRCCAPWPNGGSPGEPPITTAPAAGGTCVSKRNCALEGSLPGFRYIPALSEPTEEDAWDGEVGLITDVVARHESNL